MRQLILVFLKLGTFGFGGPAVHLAMMEEEVVRRRKWMTHEHFLDLVGATNLIPGPNSTEMTMHCGYERAGWKGLIAAGLAFILPAVLITSVFAWLYQQYGQLPGVEPFIYGIKPAVIAIILSAVVSLGRKALKSIELGVLGLLTVAACIAGVNEILALFACGAAGLLLYWAKRAGKTFNTLVPLFLLPVATAGGNISLLTLFLKFLKVGALLYGSGFVLFAYLDAELVKQGFLSRQELIDAVAVGQFTPGPILTAATFVGWQLWGPWGALLATAGVFLPSFLLVAVTNPLVPRMRRSKPIAALLDAVNMAAVAVILAVGIQMGRETLTDWRTILIALTSLAVTLLYKRINSAWIVVGGAAAGYLLTMVG